MNAQSGAAQVLRISGDMDMARAAEVTSSLEAATADARGGVVVDLSAVTLLDCAGLQPLLEARNKLGDRLWLRRPAPPVLRLLALTCLTATFQVVHRQPPPEQDRTLAVDDSEGDGDHGPAHHSPEVRSQRLADYEQWKRHRDSPLHYMPPDPA